MRWLWREFLYRIDWHWLAGIPTPAWWFEHAARHGEKEWRHRQEWIAGKRARRPLVKRERVWAAWRKGDGWVPVDSKVHAERLEAAGFVVIGPGFGAHERSPREF